MNDLVTTGHSHAPNVFGRQGMAMGAINAGAVSIEQERAIAEAQGQLILAKRFPRDLTRAHAEVLQACQYPAMANVAFYNVPRAGGKVSGPSIRLAEEIARIVGNFQYGHRELSRDGDKSEVEVFAWDMEGNNRSVRQITVMHVTDTKDGPKKLRDQKDIDDKIANVASKQVRGRILALVPKFLVEAAIQECRKTLAGDNTLPLIDRVRRMTQAFAPYGVNANHLETWLGHKLDDTTADELVDLTGIYNALKEGGKPSEFFGTPEADDAPAGGAAEKVAGAAARGAEKKATAPAKPKAEPAAQQQPPAPQEPAQQAQAETPPAEHPKPAAPVEQAAQEAQQAAPEPEQPQQAAAPAEQAQAPAPEAAAPASAPEAMF